MALPQNQVRYKEICKPTFEKIEKTLTEIKEQVYNHIPTRINRFSTTIIILLGGIIAALGAVLFVK